MSYWWKSLNTLKKLRMKGQPILKFTGEGSQARDEFNWVGIIQGFEDGTIYNGTTKKVEYIVIKIIKHNFSYGDSRNKLAPELFKYPLVNADIQNVNGVWMLFT